MPGTLDYINLLKQNDVSHRTIGYLYNRCLRIAITTLAKRYSVTNHTFLNVDTSIESIASDALISLFICSKPGEPINLLKSITNWEKPLENEEDAEFLVHKIVWKRIAQHVTVLLKEADPFFKKIHSSLKHYIEKNDYNRITYFGIIYITEAQNKKIVGKVISSDEMEKLPDELFYCKHEEIFSNAFRYIENNTDFFPAVPLNALIRKLKYIKWNEHIVPVELSSLPYFEEKMDINTIVANSLNQIYRNLDESYSKSIKIDRKL